MSRHGLAVVSGVLTATCVVPYLSDIARGTTRPQRVSWFVFAALSTVAAVVQFVDGDLAGAWLATGSALGFVTVFVVSIRHGVGGTSAADRIAIVVGVVGVAASIIVEHAMVALLAVIVAEVLAIAITVRKARVVPWSETMSTWCVDGLAGVVAIAAVSTVSIGELLYPVHHALVNGWVVLTIVRGRRAGRSAQADAVGSPERLGVHERAGDRRVVVR